MTGGVARETTRGRPVRIVRVIGCALLAAVSSACMRGSAGEPCQRTGDGFLARHNCKTFCLAFPISCPDGFSVTPNVCAGTESCVEGQCPAGQVCIRVNADRSFCVPEIICPAWRTMGIPNPVLTPDAEIRRQMNATRRKLEPVE